MKAKARTGSRAAAAPKKTIKKLYKSPNQGLIGKARGLAAGIIPGSSRAQTTSGLSDAMGAASKFKQIRGK